MEDRYLFKAKRLDNGEWVQGALLDGESHCLIGEEIKFSPYIEHECKIVGYEVDRNTICQCTGLKDKNGKSIWENDIVKINNSKMNTLITFRDFEIICTIPNEKYYKHRLEYNTEYEVIGNIFDNPELLESEE